VAGRLSLTDAMLADPARSATLASAGVTRAELEAAVDPAAYLGTAAEFVRRALTAHRNRAAEERSRAQ
jgi:hypothetical protein